MSAALKVPKNTLSSIILKWKNFRTTKTLPRAVSQDKLSNRGRKAIGQGSDQEPEENGRNSSNTGVPNLPMKTQGCIRCQRRFNKVLSKGSESLYKCYISLFFISLLYICKNCFFLNGVECVEKTI
jgi:hypothetical protein